MSYVTRFTASQQAAVQGLEEIIRAGFLQTGISDVKVIVTEEMVDRVDTAFRNAFKVRRVIFEGKHPMKIAITVCSQHIPSMRDVDSTRVSESDAESLKWQPIEATIESKDGKDVWELKRFSEPVPHWVPKGELEQHIKGPAII